jgi:hypothetical protein
MQRRPSRAFGNNNSSEQRKGALAPRFRQRYEDFHAPIQAARSAVLRHWICSLGGIVLLLLLGQSSAFAARIVVGGQCTLARAIESANNDASRFCRPGRGADRIVLPRDRQITLRRANNAIFGPTGLPVIRTRITIIGNGSSIVRGRGAAQFRLFAVARTGGLTLIRLRLRGGFAPRLGGGGIRSIGRLTIINVIFDGNFALGTGGGFWATNIIVIINTRFIRNRSFCRCPPGLFCAAVVRPECRGGGGFYDTGPIILPTVLPSLTVQASTFEENFADQSGGGLQICGEATIEDSVLTDNTASVGGAVAIAEDTSVEMTDTTLTDNTATASGGGITINTGSDITLNNTVVSGNTAPVGPEAVARPGSDVVANAENTIGFGGEAGVVGFTPGPSDIVAPQPPADPVPDVAPTTPVDQLPVGQPDLGDDQPGAGDDQPGVDDQPVVDDGQPVGDDLPGADDQQAGGDDQATDDQPVADDQPIGGDQAGGDQPTGDDPAGADQTGGDQPTGDDQAGGGQDGVDDQPTGDDLPVAEELPIADQPQVEVQVTSWGASPF